MSDTSESNVRRMREPVAGGVEPLDGWELHSQFGFMAFDSSPEGRLVRLADVVWWLMKAKSLPRTKALDSLCEPIERGELIPCLYHLDGSDYARLVAPNSMFGYLTAEQQLRLAQEEANLFAPNRFASAEWLQRDRVYRPTRAAKDGVQPGIPALIKRIREEWSEPPRRQGKLDALDDRRTRLALGVPIHRAFAWWGYGKPIAAQATSPPEVSLQSLANRPRGARWSEAEQDLLMSEFNLRTRRGDGSRAAICTSMGEQLGMTRPAVEAQLKKAEARHRPSALPTASMSALRAKRRTA